MDFNKEIVIKLKRQISDQVVQIILKVTGTDKQKKPWESLTRDYKNDLRGKVARIIIDWKENGVPSRFYSEIKLLSNADILKRFELKVIEEPNKGNMPNNDTADEQSRDTFQNSFNDDEELLYPDVVDGDKNHNDVTRSAAASKNRMMSHQDSSEESEDDNRVKFDLSETIALIRNATRKDRVLTFKRILQHWAVATNQTHKALNLLLKLLKDNKPEADYDSLPYSGESLLNKDYFREKLGTDLENEIILKIRLPFIVGYYHGKHKPSSVEDLLKDFISEPIKLHPDNHGPETEGRKCTCTIYCMSCDSPMRYYLKKCKGGGYWGCERCIQRGRKLSNKGEFEEVS
ncbi:hypothetical protein DAPPUDRAFT_332646 [Daphnia pulex]|uniref:Uncharacterized protein n=1 Tax=Daphnia pulex TaxID=6669 RepID=E9HQJ1_DAPPU|nr:hypothetical protein DAPPUDRAFT_332646 [Daphnia pulex]|eukprot:EFX65992.1 hypothetical protein DAPPUDRAFT_332646 [Daphnia pulex]